MRVLLRHRQSKLYVGREPDPWVHRDHAQDYNHVSSALQAALEHPSKPDLEILLSFEDPRFDISLTLHG
jgi:hypothetical protein